MDELLTSIEKFRTEHGLSEWQFGEMVLNDRHFIRQLRVGRDLRMSTVERVKSFMASYTPTKIAS
jgi:hypothetical protein